MKCNACSNNNLQHYNASFDFEYFSSKKKYYYKQCANCKLIILIDPPYQKLNQIYPKNYYSYEILKNISTNIFYKILYYIKTYFDKKIFQDLLSLSKKKKLKILDIGGGDGHAAQYFLELDTVEKLDILDISPPQNKIINKKINYLQMKAEDIYKKKFSYKYDLIIMFNIIEHVLNPASVMNNVYKILDKNGLCLIKTPNSESLNHKIFKRFYWGGLHTPRHFNIFNYKNIKYILGNFKILKSIFTQGVPQWHASIVGFLKIKKIIKKDIPIHKRPENIFVAFFFGMLDLLILRFFKMTDQIFLVLKKD